MIIGNVIGMALIAAGLYVCILNWSVPIRWALNSKHDSWIPLVGGCLLAFGISLLSNESVSQYWWIGFLVDYGSLPGFVMTLGYLAWRALGGQKTVVEKGSHRRDKRRDRSK